MKLSKEFKVGILVVIAGAIFYLGFNFLKGVDFFSPTRTYYVEYENIDGLTVSNPVVINGMTVGRVKELQLIPGKETKIIVTLDVDDQIPVNTITTATLVSSDLLGGKMIVLDLKDGTTLVESGANLIPASETSLTEELELIAKPILNSLDTTISNFKTLMDEDDKKSIKNILGHLDSTTAIMEKMAVENRRNLASITSNLNNVIVSLGKTEKKLDPILDNMNTFTDSLNTLDLAKTLADVQSAVANMNGIMEKANSKDGTIGLMLNDKEMYLNLNTTIKRVDSLVDHLNTNPKHFLAPLGKSKKQIEKEQSKK